jgi:hypothetical protein
MLVLILFLRQVLGRRPFRAKNPRLQRARSIIACTCDNHTRSCGKPVRSPFFYFDLSSQASTLHVSSSSAQTSVSLGVSAGFLRDFQASSLTTTDPDITTEKLCEAVIKPATLTQRCAFLDTLRGRTDSSGKPSVGRATVFVSHAWRYRVNDVIDTMLDFADENPDTNHCSTSSSTTSTPRA